MCMCVTYVYTEREREKKRFVLKNQLVIVETSKSTSPESAGAPQVEDSGKHGYCSSNPKAVCWWDSLFSRGGQPLI